MSNQKSGFFSIAFRFDIVKRSLIVAVIVGTILNLINQGDVMSGNATFDFLKCMLTYMVPYCVSTYGSVSAIMSFEAARKSEESFS